MRKNNVITNYTFVFEIYFYVRLHREEEQGFRGCDVELLPPGRGAQVVQLNALEHVEEFDE